MSAARLYSVCRFCAEEKPHEEITNLTSQENQCLIEKLTVLGLAFVDFSNKILPESVCISCYELLTISCEFLQKVKRSQDVLIRLYGNQSQNVCAFPKQSVKTESIDGEYLQDDHLPSFVDAESFVKVEKYVDGEIEIFKGPFQVIPPDEIRTWSDYPSICKYCHLKVSDKAVLNEHCIEAHHTCFGSQCVDCDSHLNDFKSFIEHVKNHRPYLKNICPYCNIDISGDPNHTSKHASAHTCAICGVTFQLKHHLRTHEKITKQPPLIKPPKKRRKGPPSNNCTCPICGMIMKTPASLKGHLQTHTNRKRNYFCETCGKAYYTKGSLDVHRKIHDNTIKEACKICHKTFLTIPRLKKHVKTHNLQMPYQCDPCKRFFNSKDRLREHVKVHMNILPFQCNYCTKKFRHKSIMKTHENQHTGARPYSCNLCCMDFANWSNCNKHMKRKHGTTLAKNVMTPHGKLALNPQTGKPDILYMDSKVKEWSEIMLMGRDKKNSQDKVS